MPEIKNVFLRGRMNKDLDERIIPEGEYRDAANIQISSTESSDAGTVQNILGTRYANCTLDSTGKACVIPNTYTTTYGIGGNCVGIVENTETEKVYLFVKGTSVNAIIEFDEKTSLSVPVLVDSRDEQNKVLKFTNKITGITIIQNFLIFTDFDNAEPKIIDIGDSSLFKSGSLDSNGRAQYTATTQINSANFIESDITLIRKKPLNAPKLAFTFNSTTDPGNTFSSRVDGTEIYKDKFVRFAYRWKFTNGQYSAFSPFTDPVFFPNNAKEYDISEGHNKSMFNNLIGAKLVNIEHGKAATNSNAEVVNNIKSVDILYKESNNENIYLYKNIKVATVEAAYQTGIDISKPSKKLVLPNDQLSRAFDNIPHKAKALDVVGNRLVFGNYIDGLELEDYAPSFTVKLEDRADLNNEDSRKYLNSSGAEVAITDTTSIKDTATVKSGREYQIGVVFEDEYGRQSPVVTNETGFINVPFHTGVLAQNINGSIDTGVDDANYGKRFNIVNTSAAPTDSRIKKFRYYIKSSSNNFNNIMVEDVKKDSTDANTLYLVVPSYEVNKVSEGQFLMLKKGLGSDTPLASNAVVTTNTLYTPSDFKVKVLDIISNKPDNIAATESFDDKFFIKIKSNAYVLSEVFNKQGLAGSTGEIAESAFVYGETEIPEFPRLFLGETQEPHENDFYQYYFKEGKIFEVKRSVPSGYTVTTTFQTASFSGSPNGQSFVTLIGSGDTYTNDSNRALGTQPYIDATGTVEKVEVKFANNFPTDFKITYTNSGTASNGSPAVFETIPEDEVLDVYFETSETYNIGDWTRSQGYNLNFHNAFAMGNGVESSIIADDFNEDRIANGVKVSTITEEGYSQSTKSSSLIFSGIFNSETNINKLNEFNTTFDIVKDLNPEYGSIQKLYTRDTNLVALLEDKILNIQANKDALFNADGSVNLIANNNVLGQAIALSGEYGISQNPESFAVYGYNIYFVDRARGAVLSLIGQRINVISDKNMSAYFRENLLLETGNIIGSYDIYSDQYILTLPQTGTSLSYKNDVDGWVSRLDFLPDAGVSINGNYYTCYQGELYLHHAAEENRNVFYDLEKEAAIKLIFNQNASQIKNFKTIGYEGTTGWNTNTEAIKTDQQKGEIIEFKEKEGKYFGVISGIDENIKDIPTSEHEDKLKDFSIQGLGNISSHSGTLTFGCANAALSINSGTVGETVTGTVSSGTIQSISPSTYQSGTNFYTATILVPSGFDNSGSTIDCPASAGATSSTFTCTTANLQIPDGTTGATVTGTVSAGSIASISPSTYTNGVATYTATINIGSGFSNSGTLDCTDTATGTFGSCGLSLAVGSYSSGGTTLTGTFSGTDYTNSDAIALTVSSGTISPTTTTKSALAGGLAVTLSEGVTITATMTGGLCSQEPTVATINAPQSASVVINGPGTSFTHDNITLTASTTGTITSYQWHKSTSSGFTPSSSTAITGATSSSLTTQETTADTIYYVVRINDSTNSAQHSVVYSDRPSFTLKFIAGSSITQGACSSSTTKTIFANNSSFTAATEFYKNIQGSVVGFDEGTYSNSTNGSNNHHRFISINGIPSTAVGCAAGTQGVRASKCNDSSFDRFFNIDLDGNATLANNAVVSFTTTIDSNEYWVIEDNNYTGSTFDASPTLSSTHSSCTAQLTPVIDVTSPVVASFINEGGSAKTVTLSAATRSNQPQGITPTFQWQGGTDPSSLSNISGKTSETYDAAFADVSASAGDTIYYNCNVTYTDGGDSKTVADATNLSIRWDAFPEYSNLNYVSSGSASSPSSSACTDSSNPKTLYGNSLTNIATTTQFFSNSSGSTSGISAGTYSNGSVYAYVNASGVVESSWTSCTTFAITGATTASSYATVILTAQETGFSGTNFTWTADSTQVQTGSSNTYAATVANTFSGNVTYGCTVSGGTASNQNDTHVVTWSIPSQKVTAQLCPAGVTLNFNITNASGYTNGQVVDLTGSGFTDGCYKITNQSFTGSVDYSAQVAGSFPFQPFSSCCDCVGCSVSISGVTSKEINTSTTLTASASGFTATGYQWSESTDNSTFTNISGATSSTLSVTSSSAGSKYYKVNATASGVSVTSSAHTISWFANNPVERFYNAQALQSDCTDDDEIITVRYTSVNALANGTIFELGTTVVTCYEITGSGSGDSTNDEISTFYNSCSACQTANSADCSFSLSSSGNYNSSAGTAVITGTFGSGHTATASIGFSVSSGTVSPTSATKSQLQSGVTLTLSAGVTLTGTINSSDSCTGDTAQVSIPQSSCNSVNAYYTSSNPATDTNAANDLCGGGTAKALYINGTTLANSTQVYTASGCGTLMSGTKYYSTDNSNYFIWNGYSLSGPYTINCP